jgi:hypothetical protein
MQKLKVNSSDQNNKSCGIFHHEFKKIGFTFFWFFYDFIWILQETGKLLHYWSYPFARRTLERIVVLQCGPWGTVAGAAGQILAGSPRFLAEEGWGRV